VSAPGTGRSEVEIENRLLRRQLMAARVENQRLTGLLAGVIDVHLPEPEQAADDAAALVDAVCPPTRRRRNGEP
jgi:hypothetical protein